MHVGSLTHRLAEKLLSPMNALEPRNAETVLRKLTLPCLIKQWIILVDTFLKRNPVAPAPTAALVPQLSFSSERNTAKLSLKTLACVTAASCQQNLWRTNAVSV